MYSRYSWLGECVAVTVCCVVCVGLNMGGM